MTKKPLITRSKKTNEIEIHNWFIGLLLGIVYIFASLAFYSVLGVGILLTIVALFNLNHGFWGFLGFGLGAIILALTVNLILMRALTGKWKIDWPNIWPIGMY